MELTTSSYFFILYLVFLCLKNKRFVFYNLLFFSPLTSISILNVGNRSSSITLFQTIALILILKTLISLFRKEIKFNIKVRKSLLLFLVICAISILFIPYKSKYIVLSPDNIYTNVKFSMQCITQYYYLLLGYLIYLITLILYNNKIIDIKKSFEVLQWAFIIVLLLGILQLFMPVEIYNKFFRNTVYINNQIAFGRARISSTNIEASVLALFITPVICMLFSKFKYEANIKCLLMAIFGGIVALISNSSSFYLGLLIYLIISILISLVNKKKQLTMKKLIKFYIFSAFILIGCVIFKNVIFSGVDALIAKLNTEGVSGMERSRALVTQLDVFKHNMLLGVGFGTTRSYDLFSSWLAQVGIIGVSAYIIYIASTLISLIKNGNIDKISVAILIFVTNVIMFSSVPEFNYLYIWIYYGMADYLLQSKDETIYKNIRLFGDEYV